MKILSISLKNQTDLTGTTSTPSSKNTYSYFIVEHIFLAANYIDILPAQRPKTTTSSTKYASVPTLSGDNPVNSWDPSGECGLSTPFGCLGNCGTPKCTGEFTSQHILGTLTNANVYCPFYDYVTQTSSSNFNLSKAVNVLWYGLYQAGGANAPVVGQGRSSTHTFALIQSFNLYNSNFALDTNGACSSVGSPFRLNFQFAECTITGLLVAGENLVGGYTQSATGWFIQANEMSMAWFTAYTNNNLLQIGDQAMNIYEKILKKDTEGGYLSANNNSSSCGMSGERAYFESI